MGAALYVAYHDTSHPVAGFRVKESDKVKISASILGHRISLGSYKPSRGRTWARSCFILFSQYARNRLTSPSPILAETKENLLLPRIEEIAQKHQVGKATREF